MNDTDNDVKTAFDFLKIEQSLTNLAQNLEKAMDIIKYPQDDPINDEVIEEL